MPTLRPGEIVTELVIQIRIMPGPVVGAPSSVELTILELDLRQAVEIVVASEKAAGAPTGRLRIDALGRGRNGIPVYAEANLVEHGGRNGLAQLDYGSPRRVGKDVADSGVVTGAPQRGEVSLRHLIVDVASHQVKLVVDVV